MIRKVIVGIGIAATGGPSDSISCGDHFGPAVSRGDSQLPQPGHQVFLRTGALDPVAVGTQQLQVLDVVAATNPLRDDVVYLQDLERELRPASVASALLLTKQDVLVLTVRHRHVDVSAPGDVGAGRNPPVAGYEQGQRMGAQRLLPNYGRGFGRLIRCEQPRMGLSQSSVC